MDEERKDDLISTRPKENYQKPKKWHHQLTEQEKTLIRERSKRKAMRYKSQGIRKVITFALGLFDKDKKKQSISCEEMEKIQQACFAEEFTQRNQVRNVLRAYGLHPYGLIDNKYQQPKKHIDIARQEFKITKKETKVAFDMFGKIELRK